MYKFMDEIKEIYGISIEKDCNMHIKEGVHPFYKHKYRIIEFNFGQTVNIKNHSLPIERTYTKLFNPYTDGDTICELVEDFIERYI